MDVIVIGSGIGGLSSSALLSKAGKRVLLLEQHHRVGGGCNSFTKGECNFDVGLYYVEEMRRQTIIKTILDQVGDEAGC